ncbi:energy transducer TonB [Silvibacterium dinghuense]|uniref:Energy transducer TonB n=1 Tax=Silvibacterium dinghuense TaxID=1560006 RepID=A0A4Q1SEK4_9BACT|nr:energy transducer TonB [Silvibacterium dinghuense]RXS95557.1 energy transducer TonB [Silvibacterium dinghuense]GGH14010.1 hypothetical protein GCM10011586_34210 [Silvibacterium dinghuense]
MRAARWLLILFLTLHIPSCAAQIDQGKDLENQLKGQTLLLRTNYEPDKLAFDAQGDLKSALVPSLFYWSGVQVQSIELSSKELRIKGHRALLLIPISSDQPPVINDVRAIPLEKHAVEITIERDPTHPERLNPAFHHVFATSVNDALSDKTPKEATATLLSLPSIAPVSSLNLAACIIFGQPAGQELAKASKDITAPRIVHDVDPIPTREAILRHMGGTVVLSTIIDTEGRPTCTRIAHPLEPGLDLNALIAVSQYRFIPAKKLGNPIPVRVNIQVNFRAE